MVVFSLILSISARGLSWRWSYDSRIYNYLLPVQSVPITTEVVSLNPTHGKVYSCDRL